MKTRYKKYQDYGLTREEVEKAYFYLNNNITDSQADELRTELDGNMPVCIAGYVADALLHKKAYDRLLIDGLDYGKSDFYGYKRKGLSIVVRLLEGKWTIKTDRNL